MFRLSPLQTLIKKKKKTVPGVRWQCLQLPPVFPAPDWLSSSETPHPQLTICLPSSALEQKKAAKSWALHRAGLYPWQMAGGILSAPPTPRGLIDIRSAPSYLESRFWVSWSLRSRAQAEVTPGQVHHYIHLPPALMAHTSYTAPLHHNAEIVPLHSNEFCEIVFMLHGSDGVFSIVSNSW